MLTIIGAILAIGLLIIVHEAGHYFVAKWCGMRVDRFSIGFGPALIKWKRNETEFIIAPILFGGYVQIAGMNIAEDVDPDDPTAYPNRPVWQRFAAIFAGPGMNYLAAVVLAFLLYAIAGAPTGTSWYRISVVGKDKGFDAVGKLEPGDRVLKVNDLLVYQSYPGVRTPWLADVVKQQRDADGKVAITVLRDGKEVTVDIEPRPHTPRSEVIRYYYDLCGGPCTQYLLGVRLDQRGDVEREHIGVGGAAVASLEYPVRQSEFILAGLAEILRGREEAELRSVVGITEIAAEQFKFGWVRVIEFLMLLNVYLGLFNLLPLPALDGGRLVFLGYEMATRRRANPKVEATVHMVGVMALLLLIVVVTYNDIARLFG